MSTCGFELILLQVLQVEHIPVCYVLFYVKLQAMKYNTFEG